MTDIASGAWAASLTPLNDDLSIDFGAFDAHIRWLLAQGAAGAAVLGTTGEANSFSLTERLEMIDFLGKQGFPGERIMIGAGCCAAPDTIALMRAGLAAGFSNVLVLPPFFYKGVSDEGIFRAFAQAIEAVKDARLRVLLYDFPALSGFALSASLMDRLYKAFPGIVVGAKDSSGDLPAVAATLDRIPGFAMYAGMEGLVLSTLRKGGAGAISAFGNVMIDKLAAVCRHWRAAEAEALQANVDDALKALGAVQLLAGMKLIAAQKEILADATGHAGWRNVRPPLLALNANEAQSVLAAAKAAGLSLPA